MTSEKTVKLVVDNKAIQVQAGANLLQACLDNQIYIPSLCHADGMGNPPASCRLCLVEIEGEDKPVTACTVTVRDGMVVETDTPPVRRLQRSALKLLLSVHRVDCAPCPANKNCQLQSIAKFLKVGLKPTGLEQRLKDTEIEKDHPLLDYYPNRCVICGKCLFVCQKNQGRPFLTFAKRGLDTVISFYGIKDTLNLPCEKCLACVAICPVSAITMKNSPTGTLASPGECQET